MKTVKELAAGGRLAAFAVVGAMVATPAYAGFVSFEIRGTPVINSSGSQTEFIIDDTNDSTGDPSDKAALGSNDINGQTIGSITELRIDRLDDESRFSSGSGPNVAPYFNLWITDGAGNYAVAANEPSNPNFQPLYSDGYDLSFGDIGDKVAKIYENDDTSWLPNGGSGLTFADLAGFTIQAPSVTELNNDWSGLGSGAPRDPSNNAYGVNWVFGDTLGNYESGDDGYIVANANVAAAQVPEPATLGLMGIGLAGIGFAARRRRQSA